MKLTRSAKFTKIGTRVRCGGPAGRGRGGLRLEQQHGQTYAVQALPVSIWMLRNFVATVPRELEEAAAVDGTGSLRIFWRILFPLVAPGLIATSIFSFITAYNEFIVALTFLGQAHSDYTLPIYVTCFFTRGGAQWGPIMAASTLYTIPVVVFFLIVQRRMTSGLVGEAVKG